MTTETRQELAPETLEAVRDLILVLADSKRVLGYRYAEWMLGAPELEAGIACSSMAQDEWGHARLLYSLLKGFEDDVDALEHGRDPESYHSMAVLDASPDGWADVVALMTLADGALTVQIEALRDSSYEPLRQRVEKMLEEERFHAAHGAAWFRRLASATDASRETLTAAVERIVGPVLEWFGPDSDRTRGLAEAGVVAGTGSEIRGRLLDRVSPLLELVGADVPDVNGLDGFDEARRRTGTGAPDAEVIRRIRGDRNRDFLMD